ncbi:MAG: LCP family protein [Atopobiaceae bacterium]|nr:LCP family protein [Atopobiaceae bacterium]
MNDFERLRRDNYHVDARAKAAQQEADELGRASFRPDALEKAAQQEAVERAEEQAQNARRASQQPRRQTSRSNSGYASREVLHRGDIPSQAAAGGAVISRRNGLATGLRQMKARVGEWRMRRRAAGSARRAQYDPYHRPRASFGPGKVLAIVAVAIVALYLVVCLPIDRAISLSREESQGLRQELSLHVPGMPYYVLALGSDARDDGEPARTDTMILVRVDPLGGKLTMLSIPRDTMVEIDGYGTQKINAAYAFGGPAGAVRAVHKLTGLPISHVALIRFEGIEELVNFFGGITINVPVDVYDPEYTGLELSAGEQWMDGNTAMLFTRVRHGFELGDYQRQKNQRIVIEALMSEALALKPWDMPTLVKHMGGMVGTTMRMYSILPLMLRLKLGGGATIYQCTLPSEPADVDGVSYVVANEEALARVIDVMDSGGDPATVEW